LKANSRNIIGVTIQINEETRNSVPYLAHLDFVKGIRELTELCDYVSLDLSSEASSAGIMQFYKNPNALEKLLKAANKSRMEELGKAAALEYELA
jgi:dihydroorotate dehydrogenase